MRSVDDRLGDYRGMVLPLEALIVLVGISLNLPVWFR
jgi:hypothetical protein